MALAAWTLAFFGVLAAAQADPRQEALLVSRQALEAYGAGQYGLAADLYQRAATIDVDEPLYLYNAARASERAGRLAQAATLYRDFLARAPRGQPEVDKARQYLEALEAERRGQAPARPAPAVDVAPRQPPPPAVRPRPEAGVQAQEKGRGGWIALTALGVTGLLAGGGLLVSGALDQGDLDLKLQQRDGAGLIVGIDHAAAERQQSSINGRLVAGWAAVGVGAVAAVVGMVQLGSTSSTLAVAPTPAGGLAIAFHFRY